VVIIVLRLKVEHVDEPHGYIESGMQALAFEQLFIKRIEFPYQSCAPCAKPDEYLP